MAQLPDIIETIQLNHPKENVWKAVATKEGLAGWWMDNDLIAKEGHSFILHAGQYGDSPCTVTECVQEERLGFDWGKDWNLLFSVRPLNENLTELKVIHSGWDDEKNTEFNQPHTQIRSFMAQGWTQLIQQKLPEYLNQY